MLPTIAAAAEDLRHGRLSCIELLDRCLARIDRLEPRVQAWVFVDRDRARGDAERLDDELKKAHWRGPLHGIPIAVKDVFDVFDWSTGAGSKLWSQSVARRDATIVERLRQAGAVLMGKTVTTLFASFDPPVTRNPWNTERTPGGSSSGSAAALACDMCLGALGSQTGGSITRPASYCGVTGCKPTFGRVSGDGALPFAPSIDHPGPLGRCVHDLAIMLQAIAGPDPRDSLCSDRPVPDYVAALNAPLSPPRLGVVRGLFEDMAEPPIAPFMEQVKKTLRAKGAALANVALPASFSEVLPRHWKVMAVEGAAYHRERLQRHPEDYGPRIRSLLDEGLACPAPEYARCKEHQRQLSREMLACFQDVDALLTPAIVGPAPDRSTTGTPAFNSPWSYTGFPTVSLPAGWTPDGLPLAIQLVGPPWSEDRLLAVAAWCEEAVGVERKPVP